MRAPRRGTGGARGASDLERYDVPVSDGSGRTATALGPEQGRDACGGGHGSARIRACRSPGAFRPGQRSSVGAEGYSASRREMTSASSPVPCSRSRNTVVVRPIPTELPGCRPENGAPSGVGGQGLEEEVGGRARHGGGLRLTEEITLAEVARRAG